MNNSPSSVLDQLLSLWAQAENWILAQQELATLGVVIGLAACLTFVVVCLRGLWMAASAAHVAGTAAQVRRGSDIGARVLISRGYGKRGGAASEFLSEAARTHLKRFMFGGPFDVIDFPATVRSEAQAQALLKQAGADLVMWGDGSNRKQTVARIARRVEDRSNSSYQHRTLQLPKSKEEWNSALSEAMAYAAARELRPSLSRPQDFRAERLAPVVATLEGVLKDATHMDAYLAGDIADDFAAGVVQLTIAKLGYWPERSVELLRDTLDKIDRSKTPDRWVKAKINLGRGLKLQCERQFDPIVLQEGVGHLTDALEALRSEQKFKTAETAAQTISECQKMLGTRRRFSITRGGI